MKIVGQDISCDTKYPMLNFSVQVWSSCLISFLTFFFPFIWPLNMLVDCTIAAAWRSVDRWEPLGLFILLLLLLAFAIFPQFECDDTEEEIPCDHHCCKEWGVFPFFSVHCQHNGAKTHQPHNLVDRKEGRLPRPHPAAHKQDPQDYTKPQTARCDAHDTHSLILAESAVVMIQLLRTPYSTHDEEEDGQEKCGAEEIDLIKGWWRHTTRFFLAAPTLSIIKLPSGSSISLLVESVELPVFEDFFMTFLGKNLLVTESMMLTHSCS